MTYQETLDYMYSQLPMFHRIGAPAYKANLDNTLALAELTTNPQNSFKSLHVAGTNGKGSVSNMLASVMQESGIKTGLFTSPHLVDFRERIRVDGVMVERDYIISFIEKYKKKFEEIQPSFFEMTFALAMCWFAENKIDIAIVETGMGGRLDSTNIISPILSVITNIGFDHMQFLGNTLTEIAKEKAGIIKPCIPVIIGESEPETEKVFLEKAKEHNSEILFADKCINLSHIDSPNSAYANYKYNHDGNIEIIESPLKGYYQEKNIATVLSAIKILGAKYNLDNLQTVNGIKNTLKNTGFRGRWEVIETNPLTVCDIGHNTHGIKYIVEQLSNENYNRLHVVLGVVSDKDVTAMLELLPKEATYYFCKANIPRGLDANELRNIACNLGLMGKQYTSVIEAYNAAKKMAKQNDMIFIGGSAFVVAEVLN